MVCIRDDNNKFEFPKIEGIPLALKMILEEKVDDSFTISSKLWDGHQRRTQRNLDRGTGFTAFCADIDKPSNTIVARYGKDGKECLIPQNNKNPRMLTPRECARLQGFPENFIIPVAKTAAYRQFGNSVVIPVIRKIAEHILPYLETELRLYISSRAGFKPDAGHIWFIFKKDDDLWIGAMSEISWRNSSSEAKQDESDDDYQQTVNESDNIRITKLKERDIYARDRNVALERLELSGFTCEYDSTHNLFISRFTRK
jgi:hypothetical protein